MNTKEVAEKTRVARITVIKWCNKNNIKQKLGTNSIMEYDLSDRDIKSFEARKGKGRPAIENPLRPRKSTRKPLQYI